MHQAELVFNGVDGASGGYLLASLTPAQIVALARGEPLDREEQAALQVRHEQTLDGAGVAENVEDPTDLAQAGWGAIFAAGADPAVREALAPLLDHRRAQATPRDERFYQEYTGEDGYQPGESTVRFLARHGAGPGPADPRNVPYYLLIVGDPEAIPYRFQYQLDVQYAVGRLHFDTLDEYASYARTVVGAEGVIGRTTPCRATFFGVRNAGDRATELSAEYLVAPLAEAVAGAFPEWQVETVLAEAASKARLAGLLGGAETPSLLFTASHCLGFPHDDGRQRDHQGAILCQDWPGPRAWRGPIPPAHYFSADDVSTDIGAGAGLGGLVAFVFGCFGAGTPHLDSFAHETTGERQALAPHAFVARLPQRLLGHPRGGALAVVGHVDRAWSYSYAWYEAGAQLGVFESALQRLMKGYPVGYAMEFFDERYAELSTLIAAELEEMRYGYEPDEWELAGLWTANNDARGYVIVGDPAVRLGR